MAEKRFLTGRTAGMLVTALAGSLHHQVSASQWRPADQLALIASVVQLGFVCGRLAEALEKSGTKIMVEDYLLTPGNLPQEYVEQIETALKSLESDGAA